MEPQIGINWPLSVERIVFLVFFTEVDTWEEEHFVKSSLIAVGLKLSCTHCCVFFFPMFNFMLILTSEKEELV